jgi:type I restriction-modification system DNA methylase subunit
MAKAPDTILKLVENFEQNLESFKSQGYNEAQVRQQFINPFFEALGWDMQNKAGVAPAYRDVIYEDAIKVGGATKAPDYCFRIGGTRKFFLEAKKPAVDIKTEISPAYQLRRYAWSAKLPLSILTDFEEFAVYDCQIRPNVNDKPSTARVFYCTYKEYGDKWEQIAKIFSKEAVLKGLFDKYASEKTTKRGTTTVDKEFLAEIEEWRNELAKNIAIRNGKLSVYDLNFAVQKTIDRILFLRICEDRGIERSEQLLSYVNGGRIYSRLFELFEKSDERYNSGIFHFRREKDRPEGPDEISVNLKIDDDVLAKILKDLYYPHSPYVFSVMPAEILGNVYEQFLGKVIRLTASHQAKVEEKPEVKKAGGVYYTPSYIVDYIVKNTVGKLCEGKTPKQIEKIKILDPACGSGSFLIGAYQYLLDYHRDWYAEGEKGEKSVKSVKGVKGGKRKVYQGKGGQWFLTIDEKKRILLNNIYGVDIDSQAAEVTKLSLLLKVLENETQESLRLFHERALPDLGNNIKCGNSLIGPDFYQNRQLSLSPIAVEDKFGDEQQRKINAFDWQKEFSEIFSGKNPGFDCVIGNPPYILLQILNDRDVFNYLASNFRVAKYKIDTYHLFLEVAAKLTKYKGFWGFITPNTFLRNQHARELRHLLLRTSEIQKLLVFDYNVFDGASVDTSIIICQHSEKPSNKHSINVMRSQSNGIISNNQYIEQKQWLLHPREEFAVTMGNNVSKVIEKIDSTSFELKEIATAYFGIQTFDREKFVSDCKKTSDYRPVVDGTNIGRYTLSPSNEFVDFRPNSIKSGGKEFVYCQERIGVRQIGKVPIATLLSDGIFTLNTIYNIFFTKKTEYKIRFVLGIISSRVNQFYWQMSFYDQKKTFPKIKKPDLLSIRIPKTDFSKPDEAKQHDRMVSLVDEMLELHKKISGVKNPNEKTRIQRQIEATDDRIDKLVYELYGLTEEEIEIVKK